MAWRPKTRGRKARTHSTGIEWTGGLVSMPAYVTGEGEPYRPEMLVWMGGDGAILGVLTAMPGELLARVGESLQDTIEHPMWGPAHAPTRVRVATAEVADALRESHPQLDIVCAPTPELDAMLAVMQQKLGEDAAAGPSFLSPDITPKAMASFFEAAASLFRVKPWKIVPDDQSLLCVTIEQLGVHQAVIAVIGQMGQSYGLILFSSLDDFEAYRDAADVMDSDQVPRVPPHFALNYERGADLPVVMRKEIVAHCWQVANANAHPWLVAVDAELVARPPTAKELTMAEAIARALIKLLAEKKALRSAWKGGEPVSRTILVPTHGGDIEVSLRVPYPRAPAEFGPAHDVLGELAALARHGDPSDEDAREPLEDELQRRFAASPEARGLSELSASRIVMDFGANYFGATIATLKPTQLREIVFAIVPRKVSIAAAEARWFIEVTRAFYCYLKREYGLAQADACLKVLGASAIPKLEAALSDSANFGIAKSLFMAAVESGADLDSREGIEAWMRSIQGQPLPSAIQKLSSTPAKKTTKKTAKKTAMAAAKKTAAKKPAAKKPAKKPAKKRPK